MKGSGVEKVKGAMEPDGGEKMVSPQFLPEMERAGNVDIPRLRVPACERFGVCFRVRSSLCLSVCLGL